MCFLLLLIVCSIFLSYCFNCSSEGIYTSDIERPILIVNTIPYNETINQKTCSICLEEYKKNDQVFVSKCNHIFHKNCITSWLNNNRTCPLCVNIIVNNLYIIQCNSNLLCKQYILKDLYFESLL